MTNIDFSNIPDQSDINAGDQVQTFDISSGDDVPKTRDLGQIRNWIDSAPGSRTPGAAPADLQFRTPLGSESITISDGTPWNRINSFVAPAETRGSHIELNVQDTGVGSFAYADWQALSVVDSRTRPRPSIVGNSVDVEIAGITFTVGKINNVDSSRPQDEYFAVGASSNGNYVIGFNYVQLALETFADRNTPNEQVPYDRLPLPDPGNSNQGKVPTANASGGYDLQVPASGGGGGLNQASVDARIAPWAQAANTDAIPYEGKLKDSLFGDVDNEVETDVQQTIQMSANAAVSRVAALGNAFTLTSEQLVDGATIDVDWHCDWEGSFAPSSLSLQLWTSGMPTNRIVGDAVDIDVTGTGNARSGSHSFAIDTSVSQYIFEVYGGTGSNASRVDFTIENINIRYEDGKADPIIRAVALGVIEDWAHNDNTMTIPKAKLPGDVTYQGEIEIVRNAGIHYTDANVGRTLVSTSQNSFASGATTFGPVLDLDTYSHGELHLSLEISVQPVSDVNMGFEEGKVNQTEDDRKLALSNILFASDIAAQDAIQATGAGISPNGIEAFRVTLYSASTEVGYYNLYITRNSQNQVGWYVYYEGAAGGTGASLTAVLRSSFTPSNASAATAKNSRGALQATSSVLPTGNNASLSSITWTLPAGSGVETSGGNVREPLLRVTPTQNGWWFVSEVNGVEFQESFVEFEPLRTNPSLTESGLIFSSVRGHAGLRVGVVQATNGNWSLTPSANGLPASSRIKIYLAVI